MPEVHHVKPAVTKAELQQKEKEKEKQQRKELSEEEKQMITRSEDFTKFFDRASRVVERALYEDNSAVFADYTASGAHGDDVYTDKTHAGLTLNRYGSIICIQKC